MQAERQFEQALPPPPAPPAKTNFDRAKLVYRAARDAEIAGDDAEAAELFRLWRELTEGAVLR